MKVIGIIGTRRRDSQQDLNLVRKSLRSILEDDDELASGGCPEGGDRFAEVLAKSWQIPIKIYYAKWNKYGKSAGFIRNKLVAKDADILIAVLPKDGSVSKGTQSTIDEFYKLGKIEVIII